MERTSRADAPKGARPAEPLTVLRSYTEDERPEVLVQIGGDWQSGELLQWCADPDGEVWAEVSYRRPLDQSFMGTFPRQRVWEDREDVAPGA